MEAQADAISSHFSWSIENFSALPSDCRDSEPFLAGGYKWKVKIYPKGDTRGKSHLSIFLVVADLSIQPVGWSRTAKVHWSVVDQVCSQDSVKRATTNDTFNAEWTSWGYSSFMPLSQLNDSTKGFLVNDKLILDVWITVAQPTTPSSTFTWSIENFSRWLSHDLSSTTFTVGDYRWCMSVGNSPSGSGDNVNHLQMYLNAADSDKLPRGWSRYVQFDFSVVDQVDSQNTVRKGAKCKFGAKTLSWGYSTLMPISDLNGAGRGFLVNDTLIIKAWISLAQDETTSSIFTWTIENFSTMSETLFSDSFVSSTYKWQVSLYPLGRGDNDDTLSLYLSVLNTDKHPGGWSTYAECDFSVVDQVCSQYTTRKGLIFLAGFVIFRAFLMELNTFSKKLK